HFDDDGRHGNIHHADRLADPHLDRDRNHSFGGSKNLQELRLRFDVVNAEIDRSHERPCFPQVSQDEPEESIEQHLFDFGNLPVRAELQLAIASQQDFQNGKNERRIQFQNSIPVIWFQPQRGNARGRRQAFEKFRIGQLLDTYQIDYDVRSQIRRKARYEVTHKVVV